MIRVFLIFSLLGTLALARGTAQQLQKEIPGSRFNECLSGLDSESLKTPGFDLLLDDLKRVPSYSKSVWNFNRRYARNALNILIPRWNDDFWPSGLCGGLPREPADCITSPKERYIICNPAVGRQLSSPLLTSGIGSVEVRFAAQFILLTLIGHELGHIQLARNSTAVHHLIRYRANNGLTCFRRPPAASKTDEEKADEIGTALACAALKSSPEIKELPNTTEGVLAILARLEDELDEGYFSMDDVCTGDLDYPSVSRRKQTFANKYFSCFYRNSFRTIESVNGDLDSTFARIETWLSDRQLRGQIGSGNYGIKPMLFNVIAQAKDRESYIAFDSTGTDSAVWSVVPIESGDLHAVSLLNWNRTGEVIDSREDKDLQQWMIHMRPGADADHPSVLKISFSCLARNCSAKQAERDLPDEARAASAENHSLAVIAKNGFTVFDSWEAFFAGTAKFSSSVEFGYDLRDSEIAWDSAHRLILFHQNGKANGGLYNVGVVTGDHVDWKVALPGGASTGVLQSARLMGGRLLVLFRSEAYAGQPSVTIWDCDASGFDSAETSTANCKTYTAPSAISDPVALASRDISSLQESSIDTVWACGHMTAVHHRGWLWLIDRQSNSNDLLVADGIAGCPQDEKMLITFRARRVDHLSIHMVPAQSVSSTLTIMTAKGPPILH